MGSFHLSKPTKSRSYILVNFFFFYCTESLWNHRSIAPATQDVLNVMKCYEKTNCGGLLVQPKKHCWFPVTVLKEEKRDLLEKEVSVILQSIPIPFIGLHLIFSPVITTQFVRKVLKHSYKTGNWSKLKSALSLRLAIISTESVPAVFKGTSAKGFAVVGKILEF